MGVLGLDGEGGLEWDELCRAGGVRREQGGRGALCKGKVLTTTEAERRGMSYGNFGSCMFSEMDEI